MERWRYEGFRKKFEGVMSRTLVAKPESGLRMEIKLGHGKKLTSDPFFFSISKKKDERERERSG